MIHLLRVTTRLSRLDRGAKRVNDARTLTLVCLLLTIHNAGPAVLHERIRVTRVAEVEKRIQAVMVGARLTFTKIEQERLYLLPPRRRRR